MGPERIVRGLRYHAEDNSPNALVCCVMLFYMLVEMVQSESVMHVPLKGGAFQVKLVIG